MSDERIEQIIETFDHYDGHYKRQEMEEAVVLKEEITPHLIRILEQLAADPASYVVDDHYANTYAVVLLAHFQEPAAHLPIIKAFSVPDELLDELWGDMATETLPTLLLQTCDGSLQAIKRLLLDQEVCEYVRGSAAQALAYAVARGVAGREEIVAFLSGLFTGDEAARGGSFWSQLVCVLADLHPEGAMEVIRKAYADGLVQHGYVGLGEIEKDLLEDKEETLAALREAADRRMSADIHDYLSRFACFRENERAQAPDPLARAQKNKKKQERAKKKMARKSKRKNRK